MEKGQNSQERVQGEPQKKTRVQESVEQVSFSVLQIGVEYSLIFKVCGQFGDAWRFDN